METSYDDRRANEIERYKSVENIHDLPPIFHYWSNKYLKPMLESCGIGGVDQFYADHFAQIAKEGARFVSIGAGYCDLEIRVAKLLRAKGLRSFTIECLELSPHLIARGRELATVEGVFPHMIFTQSDFNGWRPPTTYTGVMANHSLHHVVELETLFASIKSGLEPGGYFLTSDMIGRNGHQRWPEALEIVSQLWQELPQVYRYNQQLKRLEPEFVNWDCSTESFEGIRAQDVLPLLNEQFHFKLFVGFANLITPFIDRAFGHNFDATAQWDRDFIDRVHQMDEDGFRSGKLKPTQMFAVMTKERPLYARGLSPAMSLRLPI